MSKDDLCGFISDLFQRYQTAMLRRARKYVHSTCDAEDIVSDCWVNLIRHADQLRQKDSSAQTAYIMRCVSNKAIDLLRNRRHNVELLCEEWQYSKQSLNTTEKDVYEEAVIQEAEIMNFLQLLPPREREVLKLRLKEWKTDEIADMLHITQSSVRGYVERATNRRRSYVNSMEVDGAEN